MTQAFNLSQFANKLNTSGQTDNTGLQNSAVTVTAGTGMSGGGSVALGSSITLNNTGVTSVTAGTGISVSSSTGSVTISSTATPTTGTNTQNGYFKLPNGLIYQWGQVSGVSTSNVTVTYPISFPNAVFITMCQTYRTNSNTPTSSKAYDPPTSSAGTSSFVIVGGPDNDYFGGTYNWIAIGY